MDDKYPARAHALKVVHELGRLIPEAERSKMHGIFLQSAPVMNRHDTDRELPYHQEANFSYLTGCPIASSSVCIFFSFPALPSLENPVIHHQLLVPAAEPDLIMWSVAPPTLEEAQASFDSDGITYLDGLDGLLDGAVICAKDAPGGKLVLHTLPNTMEFPPFPTSVQKHLEGGDKSIVQQNTEYLLTALHIARITKDEFEIGLIREANRISSDAHEVLMRELGRFADKRKAGGGGKSVKRDSKEGLQKWEVESEQDAEALFVATCKRAGASQAYLPICASGTKASTLHYVCNDRLFPSTSTPRKPGDNTFVPKTPHRGCCGTIPEHDHNAPTDSTHDTAFEPQVMLIDAGCEWKDHASDITRTIPIGNGGRFTDRAGEIYELVLKMQKGCEALVKPGAHWDTIHLHGHRVLVDGFLSLGIFTGSAGDVLQSGVSAAFFPHGLGHSLGLDVHDSRQYLKAEHVAIPAESKSTPETLYAYLRIRRPLETGMVVTVEPGCYFAPQLMQDHGVWTSTFVNHDKLREYLAVGGVRIEDVVVVREGKCENLTMVGRERDWVEAACSGQK